MTILSEYYNRKERCIISKDRNGYQTTWAPFFNRYIDVALGLNVYSSKGGNDTEWMHTVFKPFYMKYDKSMEGKRFISDVSYNVEKLHKKAIPVIGAFYAPNGDGHAMVIAGYYDITVAYRKGNNKNYTSSTFRYYTVNNGAVTSYDGNYRIQYIRRKYLGLAVQLKEF